MQDADWRHMKYKLTREILKNKLSKENVPS